MPNTIDNTMSTEHDEQTTSSSKPKSKGSGGKGGGSKSENLCEHCIIAGRKNIHHNPDRCFFVHPSLAPDSWLFNNREDRDRDSGGGKDKKGKGKGKGGKKGNRK